MYIHEGWEESSGRRGLKNPVYLSSVAEEAEEFWERVWEEADARYELEGVKEIYIIGDGANWIKSALKVFPKAKYILDKFHLGGAEEKGKALRAALRFGNKEKAEEIIKGLIETASSETRRKAILELWRYIENNWEAVKEVYRQKEVRCSAEGHISHVLSARMSSRPMGWSREGAKHMAEIRVCQANGQSVANEYLNQCCRRQEALPVLAISEETIEKQRKSLKSAREVLEYTGV